VFLDIRMPGMDGMETLARLQAELASRERDASGLPPGPGAGASSRVRRPKIAAVSASVLRQERVRCLSAGFDAFLGKPFLVSELAGLLERLLEVSWDAASAGSAEGGAVCVSTELFERLKASARGYRVTELKQGLLELEQSGPAGASLAARLRRLAQYSRMTEAVALIEEAQVSATRR
ncbi:MAG TPA: response regulator, partial [Candidatus Paceibacterota bacterium]|nr:response regulator [Candidatus Paceibacterota bacterium]